MPADPARLRALSARARSEGQKAQRRKAILEGATTLLRAHRYDDVTMASVAREAGVAKGTPYLYWRTKEELFLDALAGEYDAYVDATLEALASLSEPGPDQIGACIAHEVVARPQFTKLMGLLHGVLEQNAPVEAVLDFKRRVLVGGLRASQALVALCPGLPPEAAARLVLRVHGAIVAFRQMADPAPAVREALEHPDLSMLRVDLEVELRDLVADLLIAALHRARAG